MEFNNATKKQTSHFPKTEFAIRFLMILFHYPAVENSHHRTDDSPAQHITTPMAHSRASYQYGDAKTRNTLLRHTLPPHPLLPP